MVFCGGGADGVIRSARAEFEVLIANEQQPDIALTYIKNHPETQTMYQIEQNRVAGVMLGPQGCEFGTQRTCDPHIYFFCYPKIL